VSLFRSFSPASTVSLAGSDPLHSSSRSTWPFSPVSLHMPLFSPASPSPASIVAVSPRFSPHSNCPAISIVRSLSLSLAILSLSGQPTFSSVCPIFPSKNYSSFQHSAVSLHPSQTPALFPPLYPFRFLRLFRHTKTGDGLSASPVSVPHL